MKKKALSLAAFLFINSIYIQPSQSNSDKKSNSAELVTEALELASIVKKELKNLPEEQDSKEEESKEQEKESSNMSEEANNSFNNPEETPEEEIIWPEEENLEGIIKTILKDINNPANHLSEDIKTHLNQAREKLHIDMGNLDATIIKNDFLYHLQQIYALLFTGLRLNKGIINTKKVFLKINYDQLKKVNKITIEDVKNALTLLWIEYIQRYDNDMIEISFSNQNDSTYSQSFSPLELAYFTAHSGNDFTENQLFSIYSEPYIATIFNMVQKEANSLLEDIADRAQSENLKKDELLDSVKQKLSKLYEYIFLRQQKNKHFFQLHPEFQDAFPASESIGFGKKPELPIEFAITLTKLAEVWLKLIDKNIINKDEKISLAYPEILDVVTKQSIEISVMNWMHLTACAGYDSVSKNAEYENLLKHSSIKNDYMRWITELPQKTRGLFNKFSNWTSQKFNNK